jgi:type IV secretion system protein VirB11
MISNNSAKSEIINSHYKEDTIETFKFEVSKELEQGLIPQTNKVLQKILPYYELSTKDLNQNTLWELENWLLSLGQWNELRTFLEDSLVREIIIHTQNDIELKCLGPTQLIHLEFPLRDLELKVQLLVNTKRVVFDYNHPFVSFNFCLFSQGLRISIAHESITPQRKPKIFMRKLSQDELTLESFIDTSHKKTITDLITGKKNIMIAGSTGSGKTSFMTQLLKLTSLDEHVIILEDTEEIPHLRPNFTNLLADQLNEAKSLEAYMRYALRMSPDRIILGELRSHEIIPFVLAMNTGHKGLISTIHASSARDTVYRLALLFSLYGKKQNLNYQNVLNLICNNLEYVIFLKNKKVQELIKIVGIENDQLIFDQIFNLF